MIRKVRDNNDNNTNGTISSRMDQVKFVEDSL